MYEILRLRKITIRMFCFSCLLSDLKSKVPSICKICKVKISLCTNCAQEHIVEKIGRDCELCEDMEELCTSNTQTLNCE